MATASPASRPIGVATICAAIGLAFCFIIGLAGGTAYKLWTAAAPKPQLADAAAAPTAAPAAPEIAAVPAPPPAADIAAQVAPAQPFAAPPAPAVAPPPAPVAVASAPPPQAVPAPAPPQHAEAAPAPPAAKPHVAAAPAPRPAASGMPVRLAATAAHPAPGMQSASLQSPPAAAALADRRNLPTMTGPFLIQFGAFAEEANARHVQWAIEATGLKVDVSEAKGASGHPLYLLRSADYPDYAAAAGAAQSVRAHVKQFATPIAIDYAIEADRSDTVQVKADAR